MALLNAQINTVQPNAFSPNVQEYRLPPAPKTLRSVVFAPVHYPFRKLEIKRRIKATALYETDWYDITKYVTKWGNFQMAVDDLRVNQFNFSGLNVTVKNDYGEFNPEYEGQSLFYGYLTRYRTLVRLSAGYTDGSGNQFPANAVQGVFILDANVDIATQNKEVRLNCRSIISPFEETRAGDVPGIQSPMTSSEIMETIRDATDGSGNYLFQYFISSTAWEIQSTTTDIGSFNTSTVLDNYSIWELMQKLAEAENYIICPTRLGGLMFKDRLPRSITPSWSFYGQRYRDPDIISIDNYKEATDKLYTHIRFKFRAEDTSTSYMEIGTQTTIDPRSNEWIYGRRSYEFENEFFSDSNTAFVMAKKIVAEFGNLKNELMLTSIFNPEIEVMDLVEVYHHEYNTRGDENFLWDVNNWASDTTTTDGERILFWAPETTSTIDFYGKTFKVLSKRTDLDNYKTSFTLREA